MSIDPTLTPQANLLVIEHKRRRAKDRHRSWLNRFGTAGAAIAIIGALVAIPTGKVDALAQDKNAAVSQRDDVSRAANTSADSTLALCLRGDEAAKKLAEAGLCELARQLKAAAVAAAPPPQQGASGINGQNGQNGQNGRGIASTAQVNGHFQITYTDGVTEDKGVIKGETGAAGRGITGSTIANGHLTLIYSDATTEDVGQVVGKDGVNGIDGKNGRGVASIAQANGNLVVTYTDGTTQDVGPLPKGSNGQPPVGWTEHYADGRTLDCGRVQDFNPEEPHYDCTEIASPPPPETTTVTQTTTQGLLGRP
jgi:hypothetical protein